MFLRVFKIVSVFLLVFQITPVNSQDLIIRQDSSKIFCKIIKEDSTTIYYKDNRKSNSLLASIAKSEVLKCYNHSILKNKSNVHKGSIYYSNYSLKKGDTLVLEKNNEVMFKGRFLAEHQILGLMSHDTAAYEELNKSLIYQAQLLNYTDIRIGGDGTFLNDLFNCNNAIIIAGVIVITTATLGTIYGIKGLRYAVKYNKYQKHLYNAVSLFNAAHHIN